MSGDVVKLNKDDYLMREGEESTTMYYLQSGSLAVYKLKGGAEQQIGTIYAGEIVGEMSFLDKQPRSASVRAMSDSTLTVIPNQKFDRLLKEMPAWYRALLNTLLERLRKANSRAKI